jgi:hypothetical protein
MRLALLGSQEVAAFGCAIFAWITASDFCDYNFHIYMGNTVGQLAPIIGILKSLNEIN